jgi:RHS repeat-associated protein
VLSLRAPATSPLLRAVARLLIAALVFSLVPPPSTEASIRAPASPAALPSRALPDLAAAAASAAEEVLVCVVVVVADPFSLTKSAFGELLAHTGSDPQPYAFSGEPYDPNVGFQYHRARWLDPRAGRFVGMDPFGGRTQDPATLHKYLYAAASPVDRVDPSGLEWDLASLVRGIGISNILRAAAIGYGVGTIIGAADAYLAGSDPDGIQEAAIAGGLLGSVGGSLFLVHYLQPVLLVGGNILSIVGVADALQNDNYELAGFRATLFLIGAVAYFRNIPEPDLPTGRLGTQATRDHVGQVAQALEERGWRITGGGGRLPEEYLPGPGPGTRGGNFIDITAEKNGRVLRVNTVDTYADAVTPTRREAAAAALIRSKTPGDHLVLIPKPR